MTLLDDIKKRALEKSSSMSSCRVGCPYAPKPEMWMEEKNVELDINGTW